MMKKVLYTFVLLSAILMPMATKAQTSGLQVIVSVNDPTMGTTVPSPGVHYFPVGSTASVTALPNAGYHLTGWSIQMSMMGLQVLDTTIDMAVPDVFDFLSPLHGGGSWVVGPSDVNTSIIVVANFAVGGYVPDSMLVNVAVNDPTMGTTIPAPGPHYFYEGDTCSVIAVPNSGYVLSGWNVQMSASGSLVIDTTIDFAVTDVFDFLSYFNSGNPWVVAPGYGSYSFNVTAYFIDSSLYVPDSMLVNVAVNDSTMGTTIPAPGTYRYGVGDIVSVTAVANDGYHLSGWSINVSLIGHELDTTINVAVPNVFEALATIIYGNSVWEVDPLYVNATINVTANFVDASQYIPDSMIVNVSVNNPTRGTVTPGVGTHYFTEGDTVSVVAEANSGYHLDGWTIQMIVGGSTVVDTTIDIAVRDVFDLVLLIEEIRARGDMSYFEYFHLLAKPIGRWVVDPLYAQATFNVTANFLPGNPSSTHITYAVLGHDTTRGNTNPVEGTYNISAGDAVIASATPNDGYELTAWIMEYTHPLTIFGQTYEAAVISDTVYADEPLFSNPVRYIGVVQQMLDTLPQLGMYVTAVFSPQQHTVTLNSANGTMGSVAPAGATSVIHGNSFTATATPNDGYAFVHWVDGTGTVVSTNNPYAFSVTGDVALTAVFQALNTYTVTVNYDINMGIVDITPISSTFLEGTEVTLTAEPRTGYRFVNWTAVDGTVLETGTTYTFTVTSDIIINANFESVQGIDDIDAADFQVYTIGNKIVVKGAANNSVNVFDVTGRCLLANTRAAETEAVTVPAAGVYMVKVGTAAVKRVVMIP